MMNTLLIIKRSLQLSKAFSTEYNLKIGQVYRILKKAVESNINEYSQSLRQLHSKEKTRNLDYVAMLDIALKNASPNLVLEFFEQVNLAELEQRIYALNALNSGTRPVYTLDELEDITGEMKEHLKRNKEHLINTGFPLSSFSRSYWHDLHINKLYYVKLPFLDLYLEGDLHFAIKQTADTVKNFPEPPSLSTQVQIGKDGNLNYFYQWIKEHSEDVIWPAHQSEHLTNCKYQEAPFVKGLNKKDAEHLVALREKVFRFKLKTLEIHQEAVNKKEADGLLEKCLEAANEEIGMKIKDFIFLGRMDSFFSKVIKKRLAAPPFLKNNFGSLFYNNAGIFDLLKVIAYYEWEIANGGMDAIKKELKRFPKIDSYPEYCQELLGKASQHEYDILLDAYLGAEKLRRNHLVSSIKRTQESLSSMSATLSLEGGGQIHEAVVDQEDIKNLFHLLKNNMDFYISYIQTLAEPNKKEKYVFDLSGPVWEIVFEGKEGYLSPKKGYAMIAHLLRNKNRIINVKELDDIPKGKWKKKSQSSSIYSGTTNIEGERISHSEAEAAGPTQIELEKEGIHYETRTKDGYNAEVGGERLNELRKKVEELQTWLENVKQEKEAAKDEREKKELQDKYDEIKKYLNDERKELSAMEKGNGGNEKNPEYERLRQRVQKNINSCIKELKKYKKTRELGLHLNHFIQTAGTVYPGYYIYAPEEDIDWKVNM